MLEIFRSISIEITGIFFLFYSRLHILKNIYCSNLEININVNKYGNLFFFSLFILSKTRTDFE